MPLQTRHQKAKESEMEPNGEPEENKVLTTEEKLDQLLKNSENVFKLKTELAQLTQSVKALTADITSLKTNTDSIPKIEVSLNGLQNTIKTLTIESAANTIGVKENQTRISTLEEENVTLKAELDNLKSQT